MRQIFIFLLIANLVFFVTVYFFDESAVQSPVSAIKKALQNVDNNLVLLAEQGVSSVAPAGKKNTGHQNVGADNKSSELCTMVGPYVQLLHAEYLVEKLAALGVSAQITSVGIKDGDAYWVYLPPEMSEKEALRRLYELQKKNIESYIITKGELTNGISFGRYGDGLEAEEKMKAIKAQGYEAQIKAIPKTINETWVLLEPGADDKISQSTWLDLMSQQQNLEKRQNFCLGVASP
jgi:hypothetical protein